MSIETHTHTHSICICAHMFSLRSLTSEELCAGKLEQFVTGDDIVAGLRSCFAGLWSLDDTSEASTQAIMQAAISCPHDYVLKPQREGGGNNLYGVHSYPGPHHK